MNADLKKTLKAVTLELRHLLEGRYDSGKWKPGDLEQRLAAIGVRRDRASASVAELKHLAEEDRRARKVVDAYLKLREEAGIERSEAVAEFVRETAYTWANRLLALRCMEARELIDSVILQQEAYGGRSLEHHRLAQRHPELCAGDDDGLFAVLDKVFREQAARLPMLFDPQAPGVALRPAPAALKDCFGLLSLDPDTLRKYRIRIKEDEAVDAENEPTNPFTAPDALGWAYQYWNTEEKERVFEKVRTVKGAKIAGSDIIPATQLYTEDYMVKFLVQNSLGATWMGMHPESKLAESWEYYVKDADRAPVSRKPVREITFLDPACGSGHFLLEAFDLLYEMYGEESELTKPEEICDAILTQNLFGIDIDARAVQIAEVALWMKAAERAFEYKGVPANLVAATASHLRGEAWEEFLSSFQREPSVARVLRKFAQTMEHIDEIGSLARPAEDLREIIKEEHRLWERQVREKKEANYLFAEMNADALSGRLPFLEISDEEFGDRLFYRAKAGIDTFTEQARAAGEFEDQMLGNETRAGFRLVDLLSRRYDVVAANPPYLGSKNLGLSLKTYVERHFNAGKRDLYAAFILRNCELVTPGGRVAMVTQQSWMFLRSFADLRAREPSSVGFKGLLRETSIETAAQLGRYAFSELGNAVIQPQLFVLSRFSLDVNHRIVFFRLSEPRASDGQAEVLRSAVAGVAPRITSRPVQAKFLQIPNNPLCYWLRDRLFDLLTGQTFGAVSHVCQRLATANDARFVRFVWEVPPPEWKASRQRRRWVAFEKGGGYGRWFGHHHWTVDWEHNGARIRQTPKPRVQNEQCYFREGWTYSYMGGACLGARRIENSVFAHKSPAIFFHGHAEGGAIANCRAATLFGRAISASLQLAEGTVARVPFPTVSGDTLSQNQDACLSLKRFLVAHNLLEKHFDVVVADRGSFELASAMLSLLEGTSEKLLFSAYGIDGEDLLAVLDQTGVPPGWHVLIGGYDEIPASPRSIPTFLFDGLDDHARRNLSPEDVAVLKHRLRALYAAGPGATVEEDQEPATEAGDSEEEETTVVGARIPLPSETFVEQLSAELEVHPISIYWLLKEGRETEGWRCPPEERRLIEDRVCVVVLRLLGHRWPKQIEAGEPVPDWANPDGIIPITPLANESTLFESVQQRLRADEIDASDFAEVLGKPLDSWLATEFFKHHIKQFKKRPIAWQLQSGRFTARTSPAFACLLYYHKVNADTLPKLRSQYVGPLRQRLETELRGIQAIAAEARSDRQVKRRMELDDAVHELTAFDAKLAQVAREGFATAGLKKLLESEPLDRWCSLDGKRPHPTTTVDLVAQESAYAPDINDGVRVNIAPLQKAGLLAADVLAKKDVDKAIADRAQWRADERRWVREGKLPQPGWWPEDGDGS